MTESPRRNILLMYRSLLTGFAFFVPFPVFGNSVHISFTFSNTILQCRSNAFTRPSSFLLFRQLIRTCVLFRTDSVRIERGPVLNSSSSNRESSSGVISDFGLAVAMICIRLFGHDLKSYQLDNDRYLSSLCRMMKFILLNSELFQLQKQR